MAKIVKRQDADKRVGAKAPASGRGFDTMPDEGGVVHKRVMDASAKAEKIIADAEADAARIREEATKVRDDATKRGEQAVKDGFASGQSKGLAQVTEKLMDIERIKEKFYSNVEPEIIKLVMSIAEKVIGRIAHEYPEVIKSVVGQALEKSLGDRITVRMNPEDYKTLMADDHDFKEILDRTKRLHFREDEAISKGGCVVETEVGTIDAQLETQVEAIKKALMT